MMKIFNDIIEIMRLSQHMVQLIKSGGDDEIIIGAITPYFEKIRNICNAAKSDIQRYGEHS